MKTLVLVGDIFLTLGAFDFVKKVNIVVLKQYYVGLSFRFKSVSHMVFSTI